jgi:hypothetical protein
MQTSRTKKGFWEPKAKKKDKERIVLAEKRNRMEVEERKDKYLCKSTNHTRQIMHKNVKAV